MTITATTTVEFFRPAAAGRVHVLDRVENRLGVPLYDVQVGLCGRAGLPGRQDGVSTFDDVDLCARCWRLFPADRRHELFAHDQETP